MPFHQLYDPDPVHCHDRHGPTHRRPFTGDARWCRGSDRAEREPAEAQPGDAYHPPSVGTITAEQRLTRRLARGSEAGTVQLLGRLPLTAPTAVTEAVPAHRACGRVDSMPADPSRRWAPIQRANGNIPEVAVGWLSEHGASVRVVDVREPSEYHGEHGHIEGSELVPLATLHEAAVAWDREQPLVVVCRSGRRSGVAALELEAMGFVRVASLAGGMLDWHQAGLPALTTGVKSAD